MEEEEPIDRKDVDIPSSEDDELMDLIRNELERFLLGRRSFSGSDIPAQSSLYETFTPDETRDTRGYENGVKPNHQHEEIRNYEAPIIDDFLQYDQIGSSNFEAPIIKEFGPKYDQIQNKNKIISERKTDTRQYDQIQNSNNLFKERSTNAKRLGSGSYLDTRSEFLDSQPRPDKLLELIPQDQRDKYPVEVEEISYEVMLQRILSFMQILM